MVNIKCVFSLSGRPFSSPAWPLPLLPQAALHLHRAHHHGAKGQDGANGVRNIQLDNVSWKITRPRFALDTRRRLDKVGKKERPFHIFFGPRLNPHHKVGGGGGGGGLGLSGKKGKKPGLD